VASKKANATYLKGSLPAAQMEEKTKETPADPGAPEKQPLKHKVKQRSTKLSPNNDREQKHTKLTWDMCSHCW